MSCTKKAEEAGKKEKAAEGKKDGKKREYQAHVSARYKVNDHWEYNAFTEYIDAVDEDDAKERLKSELAKQGYSNMKFSEVMPND